MISIIIPIYNSSRYLETCLDSCLSQSFTDFEIIAVNDGSTDNSQEILETYAQNDSRIVVVNQKNGGSTRAREAGIIRAQGEYLFFLDSDDTITPDALEVLWKEAQLSNLDIIIGRIVSVLESGKIIADSPNSLIYKESKQALLCSLLAKSVAPTLCGRLIRKRLFENITQPYEYVIGEDGITLYEMLKTHNPTFSLVDRKLYNYIQRPGSIMNTNMVASANQRMKFMIWVYEHLKTIEHNDELENCKAKFFIEEYFSFLRDGGTDCPTELKEHIHKHYLKNKWAVSQTAPWRLLLVRTYKLSPILGKITRRFLVNLRKIMR